MNKFSLYLFIALAFIGLFSSCSNKSSSLDEYSWILGEWEYNSGDYEEYEIWSQTSDTLYEGINFRVQDGDTVIGEHLWLQSVQGFISLSARVYGHNNNEKINFDLTLRNKQMVRFENSKHDFPTIIEYVHKGNDHLIVHVRSDEESLPPIEMKRLL